MTYVALANITLGSSQNTVTFSSIPNTFRDLILVYNALSTANGSVGSLRLNGDSSNVYNEVAMYGTGSGGGLSFSYANNNENYGNFTRTTPGATIIQFMDYSATDKHKTALMRVNAAGYVIYAAALRYASTNAISSIVLGPGDGTNFATGATFALYGIAS